MFMRLGAHTVPYMYITSYSFTYIYIWGQCGTLKPRLVLELPDS